MNLKAYIDWILLPVLKLWIESYQDFVLEKKRNSLNDLVCIASAGEAIYLPIPAWVVLD